MIYHNINSVFTIWIICYVILVLMNYKFINTIKIKRSIFVGIMSCILDLWSCNDYWYSGGTFLNFFYGLAVALLSQTLPMFFYSNLHIKISTRKYFLSMKHYAILSRCLTFAAITLGMIYGFNSVHVYIFTTSTITVIGCLLRPEVFYIFLCTSVFITLITALILNSLLIFYSDLCNMWYHHNLIFPSSCIPIEEYLFIFSTMFGFCYYFNRNMR